MNMHAQAQPMHKQAQSIGEVRTPAAQHHARTHPRRLPPSIRNARTPHLLVAFSNSQSQNP